LRAFLKGDEGPDGEAGGMFVAAFMLAQIGEDKRG
jgi:hypothetical protein